MDLRIARQIAGLTQQELSDRSGVDPGTISRLEANKLHYGDVSYFGVMKLARALGVTVDLLFPLPDAEIGAKKKRSHERVGTR